MSDAGRIICVGDAMIDILASLPGPLAVGSDTPAPVRFSPGGGAANTASWLAEAGAPTIYLGRVGADGFGRDVVESLRRCGVQVLVSVDDAVPTGVCLVLIGPDGERTMIPSAGANDRLSLDDVSVIEPAATDRLHLSGYSLLKDGPRAAAVALLGRAVAAGTPVSVDAASTDPIRRFGAEAFLALVPTAATLMANAEEATELTGCSDPEDAASALASRFRAALVKCGPRGAVAAADGLVTMIATETVPMIDSTGAGDAFAAGVLAALHRGCGWREAVAAGNRLGARAVQILGARPR